MPYSYMQLSCNYDLLHSNNTYDSRVISCFHHADCALTAGSLAQKQPLLACLGIGGEASGWKRVYFDRRVTYYSSTVEGMIEVGCIHFDPNWPTVIRHVIHCRHPFLTSITTSYSDSDSDSDFRFRFTSQTLLFQALPWPPSFDNWALDS